MAHRVDTHTEAVDQLCDDLEVAFTNVFDLIQTNSQGDVQTFMQWYARVYRVASVSAGFSEIIYKRFAIYMQKELQVRVVEPLVSLLSQNDLGVFLEVSRHLRMYCDFRKIVQVVLKFIDKNYVVRQQQLPVASLMNKIVHDGVHDTVKTVLQQVNDNRQQGESVQQLQNAVQVLTELSQLVDDPVPIATTSIPCTV